jgi:uncharacterized membrane protein
MYVMDPDRGSRRRAQLRERLAEVGDSPMVEQAWRLGSSPAVRQLGGGLAAARWPRRTTLAERARQALPRQRRRTPALSPRDWALLAGFGAAIAAGLWLLNRGRSAEQGVEVVRAMTVDAPIERVWEFWNDFENFPRFMSHVREVRRTGPDRTHWVVDGPGGTPVEWDAVVTRRVPNQEIGWQTVEGALVEHEGAVRFEPAAGGATRIEVRMVYRPVAGALGRGVASLFGARPERVIADDLARVAAQLRGVRPAVGETGPRR